MPFLALAVSDAPGRLVPILVDLTYMHPYAFRRDWVGEEVDSENQLIDSLIAEVLARMPLTQTAIIVADRTFARASFVQVLQRLKRDFVVRVDGETRVHHASHVGPLGCTCASCNGLLCAGQCLWAPPGYSPGAISSVPTAAMKSSSSTMTGFSRYRRRRSARSARCRLSVVSSTKWSR